MLMIAGVLIVVVLIVLFAMLAGGGRRRPAVGSGGERTGAQARSASSDKTARKVGKMLRTRSDCCEAAKATMQVWFRENEAPALPLGACDRAEQCRCAWERVYDRRVSFRRVSEERRKAVRFDEKPDRRSGADRRQESSDNWRGH